MIATLYGHRDDLNTGFNGACFTSDEAGVVYTVPRTVEIFDVSEAKKVLRLMLKMIAHICWFEQSDVIMHLRGK